MSTRIGGLFSSTTRPVIEAARCSTTARGTEGYILMWLRLYGALKSADFNIRVVR